MNNRAVVGLCMLMVMMLLMIAADFACRGLRPLHGGPVQREPVISAPETHSVTLSYTSPSSVSQGFAQRSPRFEGDTLTCTAESISGVSGWRPRADGLCYSVDDPWAGTGNHKPQAGVWWKDLNSSF